MNPSQKLRILVVDDSVVFRLLVSDVISTISGMEVVGTAHDGKSALSKTLALKPDLLTLDIEMPGMDGIAVLTHLRSRFPRAGVIMLSSDAGRGKNRIITSLEMGAFDFVLKPKGSTMAENKAALHQTLAPLLRSFARVLEIRSIMDRKPPTLRTPGRADPGSRQNRVAGLQDGPSSAMVDPGKNPSEVVAIGVSTGGPVALTRLIPELSRNLTVPVLIVQHMPPGFTRALAKSLDSKSEAPVTEARHGELLVPGRIYIAPGGSHMKVATAANQTKMVIHITLDPPENGCRPSVDYLFRSVAQHFKDRATGVIMTGMGRDGSKGLALMKQNNSIVIAQDEN
ncbi:MAG: chemotaxis-specific protein-glutamate methyltransferase CheB, partial [Desulfobacteraceae bacterium]|nr:chemotaxis-specific protein-glutamate methyltransferase CheB [Desulfobacteraceae bacterium]